MALFLEKIRKSETVNPFLDKGNEGVRREIRQSKMRYSGVDEVRKFGVRFKGARPRQLLQVGALMIVFVNT